MKRIRHRPDQVIKKLRGVDGMLAAGRRGVQNAEDKKQRLKKLAVCTKTMGSWQPGNLIKLRRTFEEVPWRCKRVPVVEGCVLFRLS